MFERDRVYHVVTRTLMSQFLMRPDVEFTQVATRLLRMMVQRHKIELFAGVFMSNHLHLLARAPKHNMQAFMRDFLSLLARAINQLRGRTHTVFPHRYKAIPVLDAAEEERRWAYIVMNPVRAGQVGHPAQWPGYVSCPEHAYALLDTPELSILPAWRGLDAGARRARQEALIQAARHDQAKQRRRSHSKLPSLRQITERPWQHLPHHTKNSPTPPCHTTSPTLRAQYIAMMRQSQRDYRVASARFRRGLPCTFPPNTTPPGMISCQEHETSYPARELHAPLLRLLPHPDATSSPLPHARLESLSTQRPRQDEGA